MTKSYINGYDIEITILDNLQLLKIGGCKVVPEKFGLINSKYFEFVNAEYLILEGELATQGRHLIFDYSLLDNLKCENLDVALVDIRNSSMLDIKINNSYIHRWEFYDSEVTGSVTNSEFTFININGGLFNVDFLNTSFNTVKARCSIKNELSFEKTYRTFKQIYANQGDDVKAVNYFLLEKRIKRIKQWRQFIKPNIKFFYKENIFRKLYIQVTHRFSKLVKRERGPMASKVLLQLIRDADWGELDYMLFDLPHLCKLYL